MGLNSAESCKTGGNKSLYTYINAHGVDVQKHATRSLLFLSGKMCVTAFSLGFIK